MIWTVGEVEPFILLQQQLFVKATQPNYRGQLPQQILQARVAQYGRPLEPLPQIARTERGKPYFPDHPDLHFSVSHSQGLSLCALGDTSTGVDIELVRPRSPSLPRYALSDREYEWYESRGSDWDDFYRLWTMKEARVKCTGEGIFHCPAREISVPLLQGGEAEWEGFLFTAIAGEDQLKGDLFGAICEKT